MASLRDKVKRKGLTTGGKRDDHCQIPLEGSEMHY